MNEWGLFRVLSASQVWQPLDVKRRLITVHNVSHQDRGHSYVLSLPSYPIFNVKAMRQKTVEYISKCVSHVSKKYYSLCRIRFLSNIFSSQLFQKQSKTDISYYKYLLFGISVPHKHAMVLCKSQRVNKAKVLGLLTLLKQKTRKS